MVCKSDGITFEEWLSALARCGQWNGRMRTPRAWRVLYDMNLTYEQAAVSTTTRLHLVS